MRTIIDKSGIVFLTGAGFVYDAASEAGNPTGSDGKLVSYPLVSDLLQPCFGIANLPQGKSVEDLFQESFERGDQRPLEILCDMLSEADYYIASKLAERGGHENNIYRKFLRDFPDSPFLTYNNDSLVEILSIPERLGSVN